MVVAVRVNVCQCLKTGRFLSTYCRCESYEGRKRHVHNGKLKCKGFSSDGNDTAKRGKGTRFILMIVRFVRMLFCSHMALVRRR